MRPGGKAAVDRRLQGKPTQRKRVEPAVRSRKRASAVIRDYGGAAKPRWTAASAAVAPLEGLHVSLIVTTLVDWTAMTAADQSHRSAGRSSLILDDSEFQHG